MQITPEWVGSFERGHQELITKHSQRVAMNLFWDNFVVRKKSGGLIETYHYPIETSRIRREGQGGNKRFDDQAATFLEIENENAGSALRLTRNEIEDNTMASKELGGMSAVQFAKRWAIRMGILQGRWPNDLFFEALLAGETAIPKHLTVPFFSNAHIINKFALGSGTFANLMTGAASGAYPGACPIDTTNAATLDIAAANLAKAIAYIEGLRGPDGLPRNLQVKHLLAGNALKKRVYELLDTKWLTINGIENVLGRYNIDPVISPDIPATSTDYYLFPELIEGEDGGFIYQERQGFVLSSYSLATEADLQRAKLFEWSLDARDGFGYGLPEYAYKCKAT
jgi:hypothetical protein